MTTKIVPLTNCPYCAAPHGDIFLDGCELSIMREERADCIPEETHKRLIRHNSRQSQSGPCQHLAYFVLNIGSSREAELYSGRARDIWEQCAVWLNPRVRELDPKDVLRWLRRDFLSIDYLGDLDPDEPYELVSFDRDWSSFTRDGQNEMFFDVSGYAVFAADIDAFVANLIKKNEPYHAGYAV